MAAGGTARTNPGYVDAPDGERTGGGRGMGWHGYASPLIIGDRMYCHQESAAFGALDAATGKWLWTTVVGAPGTRRGTLGGAVYPSLTSAGDLVFAAEEGGGVVSLRVGEKGITVSPRGALGRMGGAYPAFAGVEAYVRGGEALWCIGDPQG